MSAHEKGYALRIQGVQKSYGDIKVLKDINLDIEPGEFVAILGRSGCGKSTLLRLIANLEEYDGGKITHQNEAVDISDIKLLYQEHRLIPWKRVWKNIALVANEPDKESVKKLLGKVGLEERMNDWPGVLSGGQKQRVALLRALSTVPKLLLLDEPLGALDALTRIEMQQLIEDLWLERGFTSILVTHDVAEAVTLADRVVLMEDGEVSLDVSIELGRRRERNNDFIYYEKMILSHIMKSREVTQVEYAI